MRGICLFFAALVVAASVSSSPARADDNLEATYRSILPSLVFIVNVGKTKKDSAFGTGFVIGNAGGHAVILTDEHVVRGAVKLIGYIQAPDVSKFELKVLAKDHKTDLAVLQSSKGEVPALTLAADQPPLGRHVAILGYPATQLIQFFQRGDNLTPSLHEGTVTAFNYDGFFIQYDAQTEHGNSGGPMFDVNTGIVYGIVDAKLNGENNQSNVATSNLVFRPFLKKNSIAFTTAAGDDATVASGTNATGSPGASGHPVSAANSGATVKISSGCATAFARFTASFGDLASSFARYGDAVKKTSNGGTGNRFTAIFAQINMNNEVKAIRSVINDEEPKLAQPLADIAASGATVTSTKLQKIVDDVKRRDQDALKWSTSRASYMSGGAFSSSVIDQASLADGQQTDATITTEISDLKALPACSQ